MSTFKKFYLEVLGKPPFKIDRKIYRISKGGAQKMATVIKSKVRRYLKDGKIEVKTQTHSYYFKIHKDEKMSVIVEGTQINSFIQNPAQVLIALASGYNTIELILSNGKRIIMTNIIEIK